MTEFLIICPLTFLAGFIDAIAGGGGLISLPAYMMAGLPVHNCIATNKLSSCMGTTIATAKYAKCGYIPWRLAFCCIPCAFAGSSIGAELALKVSDGIFTVIMMVILPLTGLYVLTRKELTATKETCGNTKTAIVSMLIAAGIGIYDGFYGPGTGTFLILLLTGLAGLGIDRANGLTKAINFTTNLSALVVFLRNGQTLIILGLIAGAFNVAGNYLGATFFTKGGSRIAKPAIITVLAIFFVKLLMGA